MITVTILINGHPTFTRSARNIGMDKDGKHKYRVDTGDILYHKREDGAVPLAIMMLETVKNIDED